MDSLDNAAWEFYCEQTAGTMSAKDFWEELSPDWQQYWRLKYLESIGTGREL